MNRRHGWGSVLVLVLGTGFLVPPSASAQAVVGATLNGNSVSVSYRLTLDHLRNIADENMVSNFTEFNGSFDDTLSDDDGTARARTSNTTNVLLGEGDPQVDDVLLENVSSRASVSGSARGDIDSVDATSDSELIVGFEVQGQPVPYLLTGSIVVNNNDAEDCTKGVVLLEAASDPIFERVETAGGDCGDSNSSIGSSSGLLPPGAYDLEAEITGGAESVTGATSYSGSYNLNLTLFPACTHLGGDAGEVITGTTGDDVICAGDGNDTINADEGNDIIFGNGGEDEINGGTGTDEIYGGADGDTIMGVGPGFGLVTGANGDFIDGGPGADVIAGSADDDFISGRNGLDVIEGGPGDDTIDAGPGETLGQPNAKDLIFGLCLGCDQSDLNPGETDNDLISGGEGPDRVLAGPGNDVIFGGEGNDELYGEQGDEIRANPGDPDGAGIQGGDGKDDIKGGPGDDFAVGGGANDDLAGQAGADKLLGQGGKDNISGGGKRDVLDGGSGDDSINSRDCIRDVVRGGPGNGDRARVDERDEVSGVEGSTGIRC